MADETTYTWWQGWLEAEIARSERALIAAQPHAKFEIWQRLDLLHALHAKPSAPESVFKNVPGQRRTARHALGAAVAAAAFAWLVIAAFALAE